MKVHIELEIAGDGTPGWEERAMEMLDRMLDWGCFQDTINEDEPNEPGECATCAGLGCVGDDVQGEGPCPQCFGTGETGHLHVTSAVVRRVA